MNWRAFALTMTAACGGQLLYAGHVAGGLILLVVALFLGLLTHKWVG